MQELFYLNALRSLPAVGDKTLRTLVEHYGSAQAAWDSHTDFSPHPALSPSAVRDLARRHELIDPEKAWQHLEQENISLLHETNPLYPKLLQEIPDHPLFLYVRGNYDWSIEKPAVAIVGSRKFTPYGEQVATRLAYDLAQAGCVIVSGLAFGIDKAAHLGAVEAGGETLAVLASGFDDAGITPRSHAPVGKRILQSGALVSEFPPGTVSHAGLFPLRNRIIAGLTSGTLVIEAAESSGSLITANLALDYNREVFAVPGSIFSETSTGTHSLIRRGAKLVTSARDVLEELAIPLHFEAPLTRSPSPESSGLSPAEGRLLHTLSHEPQHINELVRLCRLNTAEIQSTLSLLELKGLAKKIGGMQYIRL